MSGVGARVCAILLAAAFLIVSLMMIDGRAVAQNAAGQKGKARLILTRTGSLLYSGVAARVKVNDQEIAILWVGGTSTVAIAPGPTTISVDAHLHPGTWTMKLNVKAGDTYNVEISPRGESLGPALFGTIGAVIDAHTNKNAGAFQMRVVTRQ
jgi:hypothetical protein